MMESVSKLDQTQEMIIGFEKDEGELFVNNKLQQIFKSKTPVEVTFNETVELVNSLLEGKLTNQELEDVNAFYLGGIHDIE